MLQPSNNLPVCAGGFCAVTTFPTGTGLRSLAYSSLATEKLPVY